MTTILAFILATVVTLIPGNDSPTESPEFMERIWGGQECLCNEADCEWCAWPQAPVMESEEDEWIEFYALAYQEYDLMFTALFNSYETKRAKNGAMMIRSGNAGSYKFARKA